LVLWQDGFRGRGNKTTPWQTHQEGVTNEPTERCWSLIGKVGAPSRGEEDVVTLGPSRHTRGHANRPDDLSDYVHRQLIGYIGLSLPFMPRSAAQAKMDATGYLSMLRKKTTAIRRFWTTVVRRLSPS
jgi:hypothetical protein